MPLLWLSLAFLAGISLAARVELPTATWLAVAGVTFVLALLVEWRRRRTTIPGSTSSWSHDLALPYTLIPALIALGAARYQVAQPDLAAPDFIAAYNDTGIAVVVTGVVTEPPDLRDTYTLLKLRTESIQSLVDLEPRFVRGGLLARVGDEAEWRYGDRLTLTGELATPPEDETFSYRDYLARQGVFSQIQYPQASLLESGQGNPVLAAIYAFKARALQTVYRLWPDPEASLLMEGNQYQ